MKKIPRPQPRSCLTVEIRDDDVHEYCEKVEKRMEKMVNMINKLSDGLDLWDESKKQDLRDEVEQLLEEIEK